MSTYPGHCELKIERRTIPGEAPAQVIAEVEAACARVRARRPELQVDVSLILAQSSSEVGLDAPIVQALRAAVAQQQIAVRTEGMSAWTDCAILNEAGIPAICFGPGDIALAHATEEFIEVQEIQQATAILEQLARQWCGAAGATWLS